MEIHYTINGEVDGPLDYGRTDYKNIGTDEYTFECN